MKNPELTEGKPKAEVLSEEEKLEQEISFLRQKFLNYVEQWLKKIANDSSLFIAKSFFGPNSRFSIGVVYRKDHRTLELQAGDNPFCSERKKERKLNIFWQKVPLGKERQIWDLSPLSQPMFEGEKEKPEDSYGRPLTSSEIIRFLQEMLSAWQEKPPRSNDQSSSPETEVTTFPPLLPDARES